MCVAGRPFLTFVSPLTCSSSICRRGHGPERPRLPAQALPVAVRQLPHDLGGLKILADKLKDSKGEIIGVKAVHVTCTKCNGKPYLTGKFKDTTELQTAARNVNIPDYLPAAQALFARSGADAVWPE